MKNLFIPKCFIENKKNFVFLHRIDLIIKNAN